MANDDDEKGSDKQDESVKTGAAVVGGSSSADAAEKVRSDSVEAEKPAANTGEVPGTDFVALCNSCGFKLPVRSAASNHAPAVCPHCGRGGMVVLDADEQKTTPAFLPGGKAAQLGNDPAREHSAEAQEETRKSLAKTGEQQVKDARKAQSKADKDK